MSENALRGAEDGGGTHGRSDAARPLTDDRDGDYDVLEGNAGLLVDVPWDFVSGTREKR